MQPTGRVVFIKDGLIAQKRELIGVLHVPAPTRTRPAEASDAARTPSFLEFTPLNERLPMMTVGLADVKKVCRALRGAACVVTDDAVWH